MITISYLIKYKGIYRLKAHLDKTTNDFPRDVNGKIDSDDVYIDCSNKSQIYHYGHSTLVAYIPSIGRGHNIIKQIFTDECAGDLSKYTNQSSTNYEGFYKDECLNKIIYNIIDNDSEVEFRFNAKNIEIIAKYLKPKTFGANISPFSTKNLPKQKYEIPLEDLYLYKEIISKVDKGDLLLISQSTNRFFTDILSKKQAYKTIDFKSDMKMKMLRGKEYIHSIGEWGSYLDYLKEELK